MAGINRLPAPAGLLVDRSRLLRFTFEDRRYEAFQGDSIASALCAHDRWVLSRSFKYHRPRGVLTMAGQDANTLVQLDGEPNVLADREPLRDGLRVRGQNYGGSLEHDRRAWLGRVDRVLPVGFYYKAFYKPRGAWRRWERVIRDYGGLGEVSLETPHGYYDKAYAFCDVVVVGGGPAGMRAALQAASQGSEVILIDENPVLGGALAYARFDGGGAEGEALRRRLVAEIDAAPNVEVLTDAVANGLYADNWLAVLHGNRLIKLRAKSVVIASGAMEQPAVFRNNDLPGVMLGSAAQRLIRLYGVRPGRRAVILAANDAGYGVALDLLDAGAEVGAVIDPRAIAGGPLADAVIAREVPVMTGRIVAEAVAGPGNAHVTGVHVAAIEQHGAMADVVARIDCDLLCASTGYVPAAQLLSHAGAQVAYDHGLATFAVTAIPPGVHAAGSVIGRHRLDSVQADGVRAGWAAAVAAGFNTGTAPPPADPPETEGHNHRWPIFPHPRGKDFVDFDEDIEVHDLRDAAADGYAHLELMKRYSTLGMGPSQGRHSALPGVLLAAEATGREASALGRTTVRPPYTAVKFATLAGRGFEPVRHTPMHHRHVEAGATMMPAGLWLRPAHYGQEGDAAASIRAEALHVRRQVGLIDVSTLGGLEIRGPDAAEFLNRMYTFSYVKQQVGRSRYVLMTDKSGVIVDDGVACRLAEEHFYVTATTSGVQAVYQEMLWYNAQWRLAVDVTNVTAAWCGLNVAGPLSREVLAPLTDVDLSADAFPYMGVREGAVAGAPARLLRVGFVGELGYEIHVPASHGEAVWDALMAAGARHDIRLFGVEAQRLLRLEKGHIIIGQDTDGLTHPYEADMAWAISRKKPYFIGARSIQIQNERGITRKLVGFTMPGGAGAPVPEECRLVVRDDAIVGRVTSAALSPSLETVVGLAYVAPDQAVADGAFTIKLDGGRLVPARVAALPFYDPDGARQAL